MVKVITYGTYDHLHYGHIKLLERAKALGEYLIVGVTADDFDKARGKINVEQSLVERIEAVKNTGIADEIVVEEYEGQKIDDIKRYGVDIFTVGSDWAGKFDYLNEYCKVVYLERTKGVSSTELRSKENKVKIGLAGDVSKSEFKKYYKECSAVNGAEVAGVFPDLYENVVIDTNEYDGTVYQDFDGLLENCDAVYIASHPNARSDYIKKALLANKHVICKAPIALHKKDCEALFDVANFNNLILMEAIKTAYSTAFSRLILLAKSGRIGKIL